MIRKLTIIVIAVCLIGVTMSLWDTDKNSDNRGNPQPNQHDEVAQRMANATSSIHPKTDATAAKGRLRTKNGQIVANDGTNNVGLFGFDATGAMVVKVAKPGFDADTAAASNLIFNSGQNTFKIVQSGTLSLTPGSVTSSAGNFTSGTSSTSVAHGLGYTPAVVAYLFSGSQYTLLPYTSPSTAGGATANWETYSCQVDGTNVYFRVDTLVYGSTTAAFSQFTMKYYLLQETAN